MKLNWRNIRSADDILTYAREHNSDILNEERMREHKTELFKTFVKSQEKIYFKMRELECISGKPTGKCIFRVCFINTDGVVEIENNFKNKKELQIYYNNKKDEIKNKN